jgi:hypothetical protein
MRRPIHIHYHTRDAGKWEESKHPRASNGEFGSGQRFTISPAGAKRAERNLAMMADGKTLPVGSVFKHEEAPPAVVEKLEKATDAWEFYEEAGKVSTESVNLQDLVPTQESVVVDTVVEFLRSQRNTREQPKVVEYQGHKYLVDGHHRVAALVLAGIKSAPLSVYKEK